MKRWIIPAAIVAGVALLGAAVYFGYQTTRPQQESIIAPPTTVTAAPCTVEQSASAPGSAVLKRIEGVQMPAEGRLSEVLVFPGQKVQSGQVLARLGDSDKYQANAAAAELALLEAQRQLQEVREQAPLRTNQARTALVDAQKKLDQASSRRLSKTNTRATKETVDMARASVTLAKANMDAAEEVYRQYADRAESDTERAAALNQFASTRQEYIRLKANLDFLLTGISDLEIAQADSAYKLAQTEFDAAQRAWERVKDGPDALLLQQAQAKVTQAEANLNQAHQVLGNLEVRAPFAGTITEVKARSGETIAAGTTLFTIIDPAALEVEATVTEADLPVLREGMAVNLFFDALPDATVTGRIKSIIPRRGSSGDSARYTVRISLDSVPDGLAEGMKADSSIILARRENVLCLPRGVVRASGEGKASIQVWNGLATEKRAITVGLRGDKNVEVLSGLKAGEKVVAK